jgi:hypothetical protein
MALDLYGDQPAQATQQMTGGAFQTGQSVASSLFSRKGTMGAYKRKAGMNQRKLNEAIQAWGTDLVAQFSSVGEDMMNAVRQDLEQMRVEAQQARAANDMKRYQIALDRSLFDKQMLAYGQALQQAKIGDIMTGILAGIGQIGAAAGEAYTRTRDWQKYLDALRDIQFKINYNDTSHPIWE